MKIKKEKVTKDYEEVEVDLPIYYKRDFCYDQENIIEYGKIGINDCINFVVTRNLTGVIDDIEFGFDKDVDHTNYSYIIFTTNTNKHCGINFIKEDEFNKNFASALMNICKFKNNM